MHGKSWIKSHFLGAIVKKGCGKFQKSDLTSGKVEFGSVVIGKESRGKNHPNSPDFS